MTAIQGNHGNGGINHKIAICLAILILVVIIPLLSRALWGIYHKQTATAATRASAESELAYLLERKTTVEGEVARLSRSDGQEAELRAKYRVAAPGEHVVVIVEERATTSASSESEEQDSGWKKFLKFFRS